MLVSRPLSLAIAVGLALSAASLPVAARQLSPAQSRQRALSAVKSWGYQLQKMDLDAIVASPFDLLVIDHAPDRVDSVELLLRRDELKVLKAKPDGSRRVVLAYISIGEAEHYRFYWNNAWLEPDLRPTWLGAVNPQWAGNYPVEFWQPSWQSLIYGQSDSYIDRVLDAGFDGIYLDRADVYQQFAAHPNAEAEMAAFLTHLIDHARRLKPDALVVLQNAEELLRRKEIRGRIDAIAKESLYLNPEAAPLTPAAATPAAKTSDTQASLADLRLARKAGRKVFVVEYTADPIAARAARRQAEAEGFVIHFTERTLSQLNVRGPDQQVTASTPAATTAPVQ